MDDRTRLVRADETGETFRKNAAQIFLHMLDSRNSEISSSEESLEGEPSWTGGGLPIRTTAHINAAEIAGRGALRTWLHIRTQLGRFLSGLL
jgi:hypothetical protein